MSRPSKLPEWADGGSAVIAEPTGAKKAVGFVFSEKPLGQVFNWLFNLIYKWLGYYDPGSQGSTLGAWLFDEDFLGSTVSTSRWLSATSSNTTETVVSSASMPNVYGYLELHGNAASAWSYDRLGTGFDNSRSFHFAARVRVINQGAWAANSTLLVGVGSAQFFVKHSWNGNNFYNWEASGVAGSGNSTTVTPSTTGFDVLEITYDGTTISGYINGTQVFSGTGYTPNPGQQPEISASGSSNGDDGHSYIDYVKVWADR